ncbi:MAG: transglycosylase SLT domain-containing protein [Proteobacteria bacterium]|nr:transglycosylase SLT domain-containing protein [Pseudomonadota bacterium]
MFRVAVALLVVIVFAPPGAAHASDLPPIAPSVEALPGGAFETAVARFSRGDLRGARLELERLLARRRGVGMSTRVRARFLLAWIEAELGNHQLASASFYRVRKLEEHPLKEIATFHEAKADLSRGHPRTAIAECGTYRETYPEGSWFDECLLVEADAHVALQQHRAAVELYDQFLEQHPDDQRSETIQLRIAQSQEQAGEWEKAARRYRGLYISHRLPMTARRASEGIERLRAAGVDVDEISEQQLYARACSLRQAGQYDESWDLYCELLERAQAAEADGEAMASRLAAERHEFLWRNRQYEDVGHERARAYRRAPDAPGASEHAYWAVQGYAKSGLWDKAVEYQEIGMTRFGNTGRFRRTWDRTARIYASAGQYDKARETLIEWQGRSSKQRRSSKTKFFVAYYAFRNNDYETAIEGFDGLASGRSGWRTAALYWRSRAHDRLKHWKDARDDRRQVLKDDPDGWYAALIKSKERVKAGDPADLALARHGRWPGESRRELQLPAVPAGSSTAEAISRGWAEPRPGTRAPASATEWTARDSDGRLRGGATADGWGALALLVEESPEASGPGEATAEADVEPTPTGQSMAAAALVVPSTWTESDYWDRGKGVEIWEDFAEENAVHWPELPMAYELSRCGLGELAGPLLARVYEEVRDVTRSSRRRGRVRRWQASGGNDPDGQLARWAAILDLKLTAEAWRSMFAAAGYPASVSAFSINSVPLKRLGRATPERRAAWTLRYPAAYAPHVWRAGWEYDVDPLLLLSIMRAESLYKHDAVSRVGALGLIQVMPTTGNKVAALMGEADFRVDRLLEPGVNIRLGAFYLGSLMDRFGDQFPLAVGSYNGGPHNVGRWLRPKIGIPFDAMVEEIQFDETRNYVKKVTGYYAVYSDLYGAGGWVRLPEETSQDDPTVINF